MTTQYELILPPSDQLAAFADEWRMTLALGSRAAIKVAINRAFGLPDEDDGNAAAKLAHAYPGDVDDLSAAFQYAYSQIETEG